MKWWTGSKIRLADTPFPFAPRRGGPRRGLHEVYNVRIDQGAIREILARTDIGGFIGNYVALRKRGNDLVGLCPFHGEKTPSFHVHPDRGFFKCFGCGVGGDVFKFVQQLENVSFPEAARILAKRAGVELEPESPGTARIRSEKEAIYAANELAAAFFHRTLKLAPEAEAARAYVTHRGISEGTVDSFKLGYAPSQWEGLVRELEAHGFDLSLAAKAGLVKEGQRGFYDFYRGRLMIPTHATTGEVVAFGGRALDGSEPKYINTSATPVYVKGRGLFALERARRNLAGSGALIVVEGYLDCIALHQAGFPNAVASLGTAFTPEQAAELRKYAERIFVCFDADAAGGAATAKSIDLLVAVGCSARIVQLPAGEDPDSFVRARGRAAFAELLEAALPWIEFKLDRAADAIRSRFVAPSRVASEAETLVRSLPMAEWDRWRVYLASRLGLAADDLRRSRFIADPANFAPRRAGGATLARHVAPAAAPPGIERDLLATLLDEPALFGEYADRIPAATFKEERYARIFTTLSAAKAQLSVAYDVLAALSDDREAVETLASLQAVERSSKVRFVDGESRRLHVERILESLDVAELERRERDLSANIDRLFEAGLPIPPGEIEEQKRLLAAIEASRRKLLGTK
jgi:DNA primase